jgi:hypothetical protein
MFGAVYPYPSPAKRGEGGRPKAGRVGLSRQTKISHTLRDRLTLLRNVKRSAKPREINPSSRIHGF